MWHESKCVDFLRDQFAAHMGTTRNQRKTTLYYVTSASKVWNAELIRFQTYWGDWKTFAKKLFPNWITIQVFWQSLRLRVIFTCLIYGVWCAWTHACVLGLITCLIYGVYGVRERMHVCWVLNSAVVKEAGSRNSQTLHRPMFYQTYFLYIYMFFFRNQQNCVEPLQNQGFQGIFKHWFSDPLGPPFTPYV